MQVLVALNFTSYQCIYELFFTGYTTNLECVTTYPQYASNIILELYFDAENPST